MLIFTVKDREKLVLHFFQHLYTVVSTDAETDTFSIVQYAQLVIDQV